VGAGHTCTVAPGLIQTPARLVTARSLDRFGPALYIRRMVKRDDPRSRASDADRDRAIAVLREASADGRLSVDTFVSRVDRVLRVHSQRDLADLTVDVATHRSFGDRVIRRVSGASEFLRRLGRTWRAPWLPPLCLPTDSQRAQTIGRSPDCDLVLSDPTVSRRHAQLRHRPQGWEIVDLGSTNGTRLNGWRLGLAQPLHPGDVVTFGAISLAVADRPLPRSLAAE
jgi:hypothetical protein